MTSDVHVSLEFTPNPNTLKYSVNRELSSRPTGFTQKEDAEARSPLAAKLMGVPGIAGVMIGRDFVTITKTDEGDWDVVHKSASEALYDHLSKNLPVFEAGADVGGGHQGGGGAIEGKIRDILDREIRPAVAMDGGDITFDRFEDGVVYLYLQGSCAGCPSSTATLKNGIETRLRDAIPEVREVVSI